MLLRGNWDMLLTRWKLLLTSINVLFLMLLSAHVTYSAIFRSRLIDRLATALLAVPIEYAVASPSSPWDVNHPSRSHGRNLVVSTDIDRAFCRLNRYSYIQ